MLRGVFVAYFTLLHVAGHKPIDTKQKTKRRMEVKLKHQFLKKQEMLTIHFLSAENNHLKSMNRHQTPKTLT